MSYAFPFPTSLAIQCGNKYLFTGKYLTALLVSDEESCHIRYGVMDDYDANRELDAFRIIVQHLCEGNIISGDTVLLDYAHDSSHDDGRRFHNPNEIGDLKIEPPDHALIKAQPKSFDSTPFLRLNTEDLEAISLRTDSYVLSFMKQIILLNAIRKEEKLSSGLVDTFSDIFDGPLYLPYRVARNIHNAICPDSTNRFDFFDIMLPSCYR